MSTFPPSSLQPAEARFAGVAYVVTIASGLFAEVYVRGSIRVSDPAQSAANLGQFEQLYRAGVVADAVMIGAYVVVTALLYRLFKPTNPAVSLTAVLFSVLGLTLLGTMTAVLLLPLQQSGLAFDVLRFHAAAYNLSGFFFGFYCLLIGWLVLRSACVPITIGVLMSLAGAAFVVDATLTIAAPALARAIPDTVMLISLIGEGSLALWLAVFGIRAPSTESVLNIAASAADGEP